jgi:hypothetical protein
VFSLWRLNTTTRLTHSLNRDSQAPEPLCFNTFWVTAGNMEGGKRDLLATVLDVVCDFS